VPLPPQPPSYGCTQGYSLRGCPGYAPMAHRPANGMGVAIFVTGLSGLVLCWMPFLGFLLAGVGVALSGVGMSQGKKTGAGTGLAIAGLVCGVIGLIPALIILIGVLASSPY
jgi:hypothetical protein